MLTFYSEDHNLHHGKCELVDGELKPCFEMPHRAHCVLERILHQEFSKVFSPSDFGIKPLVRIHPQSYVDFLKNAWQSYLDAGGNAEHDLLPFAWPARTMRHIVPQDNIYAELGYYSFDGGAPITKGTWSAVYSSAQVALSALNAIYEGHSSAFALCRPPGHHAAADLMGGYCYLNNIAIAAQAALDRGATKVAILDVDYHHGNGTQSIFYERADVLFVSIHGDPNFEFPFFLGFKDEKGQGAGENYNLNLPLAAKSNWSVYVKALNEALACIADYDADIVMVSLGVDTFEDDPISLFQLKSADYLTMGNLIAQLHKKTLFVLEGGYAVEKIGVNAVNVLEGFFYA